jgi:hypothetical protein
VDVLINKVSSSDEWAINAIKTIQKTSKKLLVAVALTAPTECINNHKYKVLLTTNICFA